MCNDDRDEREGKRVWKDYGTEKKKIGSRTLVALDALLGVYIPNGV